MYLLYSQRCLRKLQKGRKRKILKICWNKHCIMNNTQFLLGTYLWNRSLFIMPWMQQWKCTGCEAIVTYAWMAGVLVRPDPEWSHIWISFSPEKTMRGIQLTFYLIHVYVRIDHLLHELFCEITEVEELSRFILVARELKVRSSCWRLTMAVCIIVGKVLDFSN